MKTDRPYNLLKQYGYDKYLLKRLDASSFSELEEVVRGYFSSQPDLVEHKEGKYRESAMQSIVSICENIGLSNYQNICSLLHFKK